MTGGAPDAVRRSFTLRAIAAGAIGSLLIAVGDPLSIHWFQSSYMALDFSTSGAVFVFVALVFLINTGLGRVRREWALHPGELITAYIMMIMASAIVSMGLTSQLLPIITAPYYYGDRNPDWVKYIVPILRKRPWLSPTSPQAIKDFYEGLHEGGPIPWRAWVVPLAVWLPFICALYLVMIATMVIIRKQWVERERLAFPLTQLPLEMARGAGERALVPFFRNPIMWIGFAIPFLHSSVRGLHYYYPWIPVLTTQTFVPWLALGYSLRFYLSFPMLGFFYLVNSDALFGLWFFNLVFQVIAGLMARFGAKWQENLGIFGALSPFFAHLGMGAMMALVAVGLWTARSHLRDVARKALHGDPGVDDSGEILSYRAAFWSTIGGVAFMWAWLWFSGLPVWLGLMFLVGAFVIFYGLARVVVESGLAVAVASTISAGFVVSSFGSRPFGPAGLTSLGMNYVWSSDVRTYVMVSAAHGVRMADITEGRRRPLFWIMWLAILIALAASIWVTLVLAYRLAGINLNSWFFVDGPQYPYKWVIDKLTNPTDPNVGGWVVRGAGFAFMGYLMLMRQAFVWWPFHPIGFVVGGTWIMDVLWLTCFLAWMIKGLIVRFGGLRGYILLRPAFLGLILGQFAANGVWFIVDAIMGARGNQIYWV
jgi:hypothetical protein